MPTKTISIPEDFKKALIENNLLEKFEKLPPSHKKAHLQIILEAKKPETRARRIKQAIEILCSK
jgi:uncharacterized protein YdeI (YjbR/CyaY-like superfamily)